MHGSQGPNGLVFERPVHVADSLCSVDAAASPGQKCHVHHVDPVVIVVSLVHQSKVNGTQENRHVDALDRLETLVDSSLVLEIFDESPHRALADKGVAMRK
ncbi:hypothetical protein H9L39_19988 [Fusarium oxysporum f. sp. albedinis]|nr:hypothetical protein H9L39_19988 [Fusarium oxysporum f. sp. albedinis]